MSWTADVVDTLCVYKRDGLDFYTAWNLALTVHPPRGRDIGEYRPTLFAQTVEEETVVEAFERFCCDAWNGRRPSLRHFNAQVMEDAVFRPEPAGV